jgi:hypothetical protein
LQKGALTLLLTKRILLPSPAHPPSDFRKTSKKASRSVSRRGVGATLNTTNARSQIRVSIANPFLQRFPCRALFRHASIRQRTRIIPTLQREIISSAMLILYWRLFRVITARSAIGIDHGSLSGPFSFQSSDSSVFSNTQIELC